MMKKDPPNNLANEAILASAGTGKTFTLAMRFLTLLHYGVKPDSILASTFTNKAAGEIFDKLIDELRDLSGNEKKIDGLIASGHLPEGFSTESALKLLRLLLQGRDDLKICTLDSFFLNIIRSFPLECGIHGDITLLEEEDDFLRNQALLQWIRHAAKEERNVLREMVKTASFGMDTKSLYSVLQRLVKDLYSIYLLSPEKRLYGGYCPELAAMLPLEDILKEVQLEALTENWEERFFEQLPELAGNKYIPGYVAGFAKDLRELHSLHNLSNEGEKFWLTVLQDTPDFFQQPAPVLELTFRYNRKSYTITGTLLSDLCLLLRHVRALMLYRALERTKSIYSILEAFHKEFSRIGRAKGKIFFSDIPFLLRPDPDTDLALPFSERNGIEERLDAVIDHYLLDEFQDTSDAQYNAMARLLEEVVADPSGARSLFYVGDIKQSIYQWREGNPGLFEMIRRKYLSYGDRAVEKKSLSLSYRSCMGVLEAVNSVFDASSGVTNPRTAKAIAQMQFIRHLSSESAGKQKGGSFLFEIPDTGDKQQYKAKCVYELLKKLNPFQRKKPLTVGVLFRGNKMAKAFAEYFRCFRQEELAGGRDEFSSFHISMDGKLPAVESPLFALYAQLITLPDHPGDPFARGYLQLLRLGDSPLPPEELLKKLKFADAEELIRNPLERLASSIRNDWDKGSYTLFLERFLAAFREESSEFDLARMEAVSLVTFKLDQEGKKLSADAYRTLLENASAPNTSLRGTIQMMTIHKSKGLDFDIVVMPELNDLKSSSKLMPHVAKDEDFLTRFVTFFPKDPYAVTFPELKEVLEKEALAKEYEACCNLYVGMTRARHGLYLFTNEKGKSSKSYQPRELLYETFGTQSDALEAFPEEAALPPAEEGAAAPRLLAYKGDPLWYKEEEEAEVNGSRQETLPEISRELVKKCLEKYTPGSVRFHTPVKIPDFVTPSSLHGSGEKEDMQKTIPIKGGLTFKSRTGNVTLGSRIHQILENFSFSGAMDQDTFFARFLTPEEREDSSPVPHLLRGLFLPDSPLYSALAKPENAVTELWKERSILLEEKDGKILSGTFDRVHLIREEKDPSRIREAVIFDYKTDHLENDEDFLSRYTPQMRLYIAGLAKLLSLPEEKIQAKLLALYPGKVLTVTSTPRTEEEKS